MKVGFLVSDIAFGGGERILKMLMDELYIIGHNIYIYTWNPKWKNVKDNYTVSIIKDPPIGVIGKIKATNNLYESLSNTKPDCLIVFSLALAEVATWSCLFSSIPIIISERVDPNYLPKSKIHRVLRLITYIIADGLVFQTEKVKEFYPMKIQKKSTVIPNPIIDDYLPTINFNIPSKKEIVAVGRLSEEKNFSLLIQAFAELKIPEYKLRIFGSGPLHDQLLSQIYNLNMQNNIILEGNVPRVIDHIKSSDIFVMTSNHEGMPNALMEGMAMGLACISTNFPSGGAEYLISDNVNGILIPVNDKLKLKNAILKLVEDEQFKMNIKINAIKIRDSNSKNKIIPQWENFILYNILKCK